MALIDLNVTKMTLKRDPFMMVCTGLVFGLDVGSKTRPATSKPVVRATPYDLPRSSSQCIHVDTVAANGTTSYPRCNRTTSKGWLCGAHDHALLDRWSYDPKKRQPPLDPAVVVEGIILHDLRALRFVVVDEVGIGRSKLKYVWGVQMQTLYVNDPDIDEVDFDHVEFDDVFPDDDDY